MLRVLRFFALLFLLLGAALGSCAAGEDGSSVLAAVDLADADNAVLADDLLEAELSEEDFQVVEGGDVSVDLEEVADELDLDVQSSDLDSQGSLGREKVSSFRDSAIEDMPSLDPRDVSKLDAPVAKDGDGRDLDLLNEKPSLTSKPTKEGLGSFLAESVSSPIKFSSEGVTKGAKKRRIRVTGSSTVFPFTSLVSEHFTRDNPNLESPVIESVGTGAGFRVFCTSAGRGDAPDVVNASRPMEAWEELLCRKNGVKNIGRISVGLDAIVAVYGKDTKSDGSDGFGGENLGLFESSGIGLRELYLAVSKFVVIDGERVLNPYKKWSQIRSDLPDIPIVVYGPPSSSGTYDSFVRMVISDQCMKDREVLALYASYSDLKTSCSYVRADGAYVETGENSLVIKKVLANREGVGVLSFNHYYDNRYRLGAFRIGGIEPTLENIQDGSYRVARSLYVYFNQDALDSTSGLREFLFDMFRFAYKDSSVACNKGSVSSDDSKFSGLTLVPLLTRNSADIKPSSLCNGKGSN